MNAKSQKRCLIVIAGLAALSIVCWLSLLQPRKKGVSERMRHDTVSGNQKADFPPVGNLRPNDSPKVEESASNSPTPQETARIHEKIESLRGIFRENERSSAKVVYDGVWRGPVTLTSIVIPQPNKEQSDKLYSAVTRELREFSNTPNADNEMRRDVQGPLDDYILFPDRFKALVLLARPDADLQMIKMLISDEALAKPNADGAIGGGSSSLMVPNLLKSQDILDRYGYLFKISPDGRSISSGL